MVKGPVFPEQKASDFGIQVRKDEMSSPILQICTMTVQMRQLMEPRRSRKDKDEMATYRRKLSFS